MVSVLSLSLVILYLLVVGVLLSLLGADTGSSLGSVWLLLGDGCGAGLSCFGDRGVDVGDRSSVWIVRELVSRVIEVCLALRNFLVCSKRISYSCSWR